jgi:CheY-like chemotaxis protein
MGGSIRVESMAGEGSSFYFSLKLKLQEPARPAAAPNPGLAGKRVLIVEDRPRHGEILVWRAGTLGMVPSLVSTGGRALELLRQSEAFDAVIVSSRLPDMDAIELAERLRRLPSCAATRIFLLTAQHKRLGSRGQQYPYLTFIFQPLREAQFREVFEAAFDFQVRRGAAAKTAEVDRELGLRAPLRILLAEDNPVNQKVALHFLAKMGYRADVAVNGNEVLRCMERQTYDVILMDVEMPEMNGFEATRRIHEKWRGTQRPRIIAMTANAMQGDREQCLQAGMDDYLAKPFLMKALQDTLERALKRLPVAE